ncbi:hypothetical protein H311_00401 [Anncaliia algerae PRA109]|nr:hypothetical protein H311_00401 [Anncaliia algerae PRA109]
MKNLLNDEKLEQIFEEILNKIEKKCFKCKKNCNLRKNSRTLLRCGRKGCRHEFSILKRTPFFKLKKSPIKTLRILELWAYDFKLTNIAEQLNITKSTVSKCLKSFFKKITNNYYLSIDKIGGKNCVIEVDESKFGRRKYNKGRVVEGIWILGMVERSPERKIILIPILDFRKDNIHRLLKFYLHSDSIIYTDGFKSYLGLDKYFISHKFVNHKKEYVVKNTDIHTNTIEANWSVLKRSIPPKYR